MIEAVCVALLWQSKCYRFRTEYWTSPNVAYVITEYWTSPNVAYVITEYWTSPNVAYVITEYWTSPNVAYVITEYWTSPNVAYVITEYWTSPNVAYVITEYWTSPNVAYVITEYWTSPNVAYVITELAMLSTKIMHNLRTKITFVCMQEVVADSQICLSLCLLTMPLGYHSISRVTDQHYSSSKHQHSVGHSLGLFLHVSEQGVNRVELDGTDTWTIHALTSEAVSS